MRLFCQQRWIGGRRSRQSRSYFALRLPHRCWLLGLDIQLESDIDRAQVDYFLGIARKMQKDDRIILCTAKPDWIYGSVYDRSLQDNMAFLESHIVGESGAKVVLRLAGDAHHYRRHEAADGSQYITAGGGGAFLHPTCGPKVDEIATGPADRRVTLRLKAEFPTPARCRRLALRNLLFPILNPWFGLVTAALYFVLACVFPVRGHAGDPGGFFTGLLLTLGSSPAAIAWLLLLLGGFVLFTDTHMRGYRVVAGSLHGPTHFLAALFSGWAADRAALALGTAPDSPAHLYTALLGTLVGGYLIGPFIMGLYLLISIDVFRRHSNESFSSLRIQDYKDFVRLHIDRLGTLRVYPVGLERVPRRWKEVPGREASAQPRYVPDGEQLAPHLIERPIEIR